MGVLTVTPVPNAGGEGGQGGNQVAGDSLEGTRWVLTLDIGREKNTWMAQEWAVSGMRMQIPLLVELAAGGVLKPLAVGSYVKLTTVGDGQWRMDGATLRCRVDISGFERGDVSLPAGPLFLGIPAWGALLSRDKGIATIKARRYAQPQPQRERVRAAESGAALRRLGYSDEVANRNVNVWHGATKNGP